MVVDGGELRQRRAHRNGDPVDRGENDALLDLIRSRTTDSCRYAPRAHTTFSHSLTLSLTILATSGSCLIFSTMNATSSIAVS